MAIDIERVAAAAVDSFLHGGDGERGDGPHRRGRLRTVGAVAAGVGLGVAARAAYRRVRAVDLEGAASALEERLER